MNEEQYLLPTWVYSAKDVIKKDDFDYFYDEDTFEKISEQLNTARSIGDGIKKVVSDRFERLYNDEDITIDDFYDDDDSEIDVTSVDYLEDIKDGDVWVTKERISVEWGAITDSHLDNIISCIERGKAVYGQGWKLDIAKEEKFNRTLKNYV